MSDVDIDAHVGALVSLEIERQNFYKKIRREGHLEAVATHLAGIIHGIANPLSVEASLRTPSQSAAGCTTSSSSSPRLSADADIPTRKIDPLFLCRSVTLTYRKVRRLVQPIHLILEGHLPRSS